MVMNVKLCNALFVAAIALLGLFPGAVRANKALNTSEDKVLASIKPKSPSALLKNLFGQQV